MNARESLSAIVKRYRTLDSYVDDGFVRPLGSNGTNTCFFKTHFIRPGLFRFQFTRPHPYPPLRHRLTETIIGSDGVTPYFCIKYPDSALKTDIEESLELAVAGATGISQGTAHTIGNLLLECVGGFSLSMLEHPRFRLSREFAGEHCSRITGMHPVGGRVTLWFGASDLLLRKIVWYRSQCEEIRQNIRIDQTPDRAIFGMPHE